MGAWRRGIKTKLEESSSFSAGVDELADFLRITPCYLMKKSGCYGATVAGI